MRMSIKRAPAAGATTALFLLTALLTTFSIGAQAGSSVAPAISGTPTSTVKVNSWYSWKPTVVDPDTAASRLRFTVANKPSWAAFSVYTGKVEGKPTTAGSWSNIRITVSDGVATATLPAFSITASTTGSGGTGNHAPTISGSPATSATVGTAYSFRPTAADQDGNSLGFSITNRPSWLSFNTSNGTLSGTPTSSNVATYSNIVIRVSDGQTSASLPAFSITVRAASTGAPQISGTPVTSIRSGTAYSFTPTASDPNGDALTFSIQNRPSWATFATSNGRLSGTPTSAQIGTYSNVIISVSDGRTTTSLPAFAITVSDTANGSATVSWTPPTRNTDGSTLSNLAGYRIYYGTSASSLNQTIQIANAGTARYVVNSLSPATWYFVVRAYNASGGESASSSVGSKTIP